MHSDGGLQPCETTSSHFFLNGLDPADPGGLNNSISRFAHLRINSVAAQFRRQTRVRYRGFWSDIQNGVELLFHAKEASWLSGCVKSVV